ncbi:hypothetical protein [Streptomyces sp. NBC_00154]|uniref:hypothetical protein n=1 Tax=Streptomyces sp. NBC_00154 TaxID=2975670 RepID=UPI00224D9D42|nr:hypothetical protein [Streptomyces sp. NBC_00154]MCX5312237.1 hypothetical protein [Streptomyces sp. NBC_00154]
MNHPSDTPTGPADLALPLATARRAPELRATTTVTTGRRRRAARRRATAVTG